MKSPAEKKGRRGRCPAQACQLVKLACERWAAPAIRQGFFAKWRDLAQPSPGRPRLPLGRGGPCASGPLRPPPGVPLTLSRTRRPALRPVRAHRHEQDPEWGGVRNGWHEIGIKSRLIRRLSSIGTTATEETALVLPEWIGNFRRNAGLGRLAPQKPLLAAGGGGGLP